MRSNWRIFSLAFAIAIVFSFQNCSQPEVGEVTPISSSTNSSSTNSTTNSSSDLSIRQQPQSLVVSVGAQVNLQVVAQGGTGTYSYLWYYNGNPIINATSSIYTLANAATTNSGNYTVAVMSGSTSITSSTAVLSVLDSSGGGPYRNPNPSCIVTLDTKSYLNSALLYFQSAMSTTARTTATGCYNTLYGNIQTLNSSGWPCDSTNSVVAYTQTCATNIQNELAVSPPVIITQPSSATVAPGASYSLSVSASGAVSFQWKLNGAAIPGATSSVYSAVAPNSSFQATYVVVVSNARGSVTSTAATISVSSSEPTNPGGGEGAGGR